MRQFLILLMSVLPLFAASTSSALSLDQKLLALVPPGAQAVAGMDSPPPRDKAGSFVLITHKNTMDLEDFFALTGADTSRSVHHAVFVAMDGGTNGLDEHSLLVSGHFDQTHVYKSAADGGASLVQYRGISVMTIQPFARELKTFNEIRWLAILDSDLLLFGSITSVREELDRYLDGSATDPVLLHKLARMRNDDETWSVLAVPARNPEIQVALESLDSKLADLAKGAEAFQFGVRYRKQVEFEYEVTMATVTAPPAIPNPLMQSFVRPGKGAWLLPSGVTGNDNTVRGVIKIPVAQFSKWMAGISGSSRGPTVTAPVNP
jgi:hypothetical protein